MLVALSTKVWASEVTGMIALGIFLVFSGWIVLQRFRSPHPTDQADLDTTTKRQDDDA